MKTIHVTASRSYDVCIGPGLLASCGARIAAVTGRCIAALVTESTVAPLYAAKVRVSLEAAGFRVEQFVFPAGEASKNLEVYGRVLAFLAEKRLTRGDILVALGGGVVGDLGGFAAATYQRGIRFVQLPTTLLSAVDSSVGGKTAVDLPVGKNMVGCFYQPSLVLCDPETLTTLPETVFQDGCAEVVKCAVLSGEDFFASLERTPIRDQVEDVIARCVTLKRDVVAEDEFDTGARRLLNLGHSVGHAIELCSAYTVSHGSAVARGLAIIAAAAAGKGYCTLETASRVKALLERHGLATASPFDAQSLFAASFADKKREGDKLRLVVPYAIGDCRVETIPAADMLSWIRAGGVA